MKKSRAVIWILSYIIVVVFALLTVFAKYLVKNGTSLEVLIYTLQAGTEGTDNTVICNGLKFILPRAAVQAAAWALIIGVWHVIKRRVRIRLFIKDKEHDGSRALSAVMILCMLALSVVPGITSMNSQLQIIDMIKNGTQTTTLYEEYYIAPETVSLTAPETQKNLIFVWLESMETTYGEKYMPNLTRIANENTCFKGNASLSGMHAVRGSNWTFGALFSASSATPYAYKIKKNIKWERVLAPDTPFVWDVLRQAGYSTEYILGSDADFAGTDVLLSAHGFDKILGLEQMYGTYLTEGYRQGWGVEDYKLYQIAETEIAGMSEPFCVMLSTIDTHAPGGYSCARCGSEYATKTENVVACADRLASEFLDWCRAQEFYENTVIVFMGDHPRMDNNMINGAEYYDRTLYNVIINPAKEAVLTENREFTVIDLYPTLLGALGYKIEGDRIGFGTNLFSDRQTLYEEIGYEYFESEILKTSEYFIEHF